MYSYCINKIILSIFYFFLALAINGVIYLTKCIPYLSAPHKGQQIYLKKHLNKGWTQACWGPKVRQEFWLGLARNTKYIWGPSHIGWQPSLNLWWPYPRFQVDIKEHMGHDGDFQDSTDQRLRSWAGVPSSIFWPEGSEPSQNSASQSQPRKVVWKDTMINSIKIHWEVQDNQQSCIPSDQLLELVIHQGGLGCFSPTTWSGIQIIHPGKHEVVLPSPIQSPCSRMQQFWLVDLLGPRNWHFITYFNTEAATPSLKTFNYLLEPVNQPAKCYVKQSK